MPYPIEKKLVVGVSSNALFDLEVEDSIFINQGAEAFDKYQIDNKKVILKKGVAFPFVERFLNINKHYQEEQPVEVVLLSKNSPGAGIRVFNSIKEYNLDISRAAFTTGKSPFQYIPAYNISLFLSTDIKDVERAIAANYPAGRFINNPIIEEEGTELRVAFDFDGVIADDKAEAVYKETKNLADFHKYETEHIIEPHSPGPLADFFKKLAYFQKLEESRKNSDPNYKLLLRTSIVTARNAPSHERAINTLNEWGVSVDEMFLMGGVDKSRVLNILKPHIYFDDQLIHLDSETTKIPLVHIPFGIANEHKEHS